MNTTWDLFLKKYNETSNEMRVFIDSEEIPNFAREYKTSHEKSPKNVHDITSMLADYLLGVTNSNQLKIDLNITDDEVTLLVSKITSTQEEFIKRLTGDASIPAANLESKERLELHPDGERGNVANSGEVVGADGKVVQKDGAAKPLTRDELMSALAGKRTMAGDIEAVRKAREAAKNE